MSGTHPCVELRQTFLDRSSFVLSFRPSSNGSRFNGGYFDQVETENIWICMVRAKPKKATPGGGATSMQTRRDIEALDGSWPERTPSRTHAEQVFSIERVCSADRSDMYCRRLRQAQCILMDLNSGCFSLRRRRGLSVGRKTSVLDTL